MPPLGAGGRTWRGDCPPGESQHGGQGFQELSPNRGASCGREGAPVSVWAAESPGFPSWQETIAFLPA